MSGNSEVFVPEPQGDLAPEEIRAIGEALGEATVSVVLPALNEEATVGGVIDSLSAYRGNLAAEIVVMDSGSSDATVAVAEAHGATVVRRHEVLPDVEPLPGKGEVLWRSLVATTGDIIVFLDADLRDPDLQYLPRLLLPFVTDPQVQMVKGYYRRPEVAGEGGPTGGGRVTELVARPLLAALVPELRTIVQPLGGEYAGRRELLESLAFPPGYGVEIGLLIDTWRRFGMSAIGQVDLGTRRHRHRSVQELGVMSRQIIATIFDRLGIADSGADLVQFVDDGRGLGALAAGLDAPDRPPLARLRGERGESSARAVHGAGGAPADGAARGTGAVGARQY